MNEIEYDKLSDDQKMDLFRLFLEDKLEEKYVGFASEGSPVSWHHPDSIGPGRTYRQKAQ